jgi:hypothetical protein
MAFEESTIKAKAVGVSRARPLAAVLVPSGSLGRFDGLGLGSWHNSLK